MPTFRGELFLYSETGTEGGYWALQDEKFTNLPAPDQWACTRCGRVWDRDKNPTEEPKPFFTYWRPDWEENGQRYLGGHFASDVPRDDLPLSRPDNDLDAEWTKATNEVAYKCYTEGHPDWRHMYPNGISSYEGLHTLNTGDHLVIYDNTNAVVWEGDINLNEYELFTEDAGGMWIHADQQGVDRETWAAWFTSGFTGELTTNDNTN